MQTHKIYFSKFEGIVREFIGLPLTFIYNEEDKLIDLKIESLDKDLYEVNKKNLDDIIERVMRVLISFYDNHQNLEFRPILKQLLMEELAYGFIDKSYPEINGSLSLFIENLKKLCIKTYESESTEMGFIIFSDNKVNVQEFLEKRDLKYISLSIPKSLEYFMTDKQTLKIIDSKTVSFVINNDYQVIGLAQKMKNKQSIIDIMMHRHRFIEERDIKLLSHNYYVARQLPERSTFSDSLLILNDLQKETLNKIKVEFKINNDENDIEKILKQIYSEKLTEEQEGQLNGHVELYASLLEKENALLIEKYKALNNTKMSSKYLVEILREKLNDLQNEQDLKKVDFVYFKNKQVIWSSSYEYIISYLNGQWKLRNYFVLRSILTRFIMSQYSSSNIAYIIDKINYSIPRVLNLYNFTKNLSEKNIGSLICIMNRSTQRFQTIFKSMLQSGKLSSEKYKTIIQTENDRQINIKSCDPYLFELIASIDGAILLDYKLHILSFGEMISSRPNTTNNGYRGARTLAALSASFYGLGLKISEDGDMQIFENEREIARI